MSSLKRIEGIQKSIDFYRRELDRAIANLAQALTKQIEECVDTPTANEISQTICKMPKSQERKKLARLMLDSPLALTHGWPAQLINIMYEDRQEPRY